MAFTKEDLKKLGLDDEQTEKVLAERGKEIEAEKKKLKMVQDELDEKNETLKKVQTDFEDLKAKDISNAEFKEKFENLQKEVKDKEQKAEQERLAKAKADAIADRFSKVSEGKQWTHDAIRNSYLQKFADAVEDQENVGKSDSDLFMALVKDDASAFVVPRGQVKLQGANAKVDNALTKEQILAIKDGTKRRAAMAEALKSDPDFFKGDDK